MSNKNDFISIPIGTLCSECDKRASCRTLCKEAEQYADQDTKKQAEVTIGLPKYRNGKVFMTKSNEEIIMSLYFNKRLKQQEIADIIGINQSHVSRTVRKYKAIIMENLKK